VFTDFVSQLRLIFRVGGLFEFDGNGRIYERVSWGLKEALERFELCDRLVLSASGCRSNG
jgi:hypothetical protein